jgi:hypothetical protein
MRKTTKLLPLTSILLAVLLVGGCVSYAVRVNGFLDPAEGGQLPKGSSVFVVEDSTPKNSILDREIKGKIEKLVARRGFIPGSFETAQYMLLYGYGVGPERQVTRTVPVYESGGTATVTTTGPRGAKYSTIELPGHTTYVQQTSSVYDRWLTLKLIDGREYRASGKAKDIWIGEITSPGQDADIRGAIDYMLIGAFAHFGENTGRQLTLSIPEDDPTLQALKGP